MVPMAKIRQQRLRRFKSPWVSAEEVRLGKPESGPRWDSNAITPGTAFMEKLGKALHEIRGSHGVQWVVSDASEPGEGEHKIMKLMRSVSGEHVVYGLDADLIVLCLLQLREGEKNITLFREAIECGEVQ